MSQSPAPTRTTRVELDGGAMDLHLWLPQSGDGGDVPGLVLCHEIFGVGDYIRDRAAALVAEGYAVAAPDLFWRFSPGWAASHDAEGLAASMQQGQQLDRERAVEDCVASLDALAAMEEVERPGVIGFCLGGTLAFATAIAADPAVCVSYYGSGVGELVGRIDEVRCPTLFHFGAEDEYMPDGTPEAIAAAIEDRHGFVVNVERAGHAFDNHRAPMFHDESAAGAAWAKTVAFLRTHLPAR